MFQRQKDARQKEFARRREDFQLTVSQNNTPPAAAEPVARGDGLDEDIELQLLLEKHFEEVNLKRKESDREMAAILDELAITPAPRRLTRAVASSALDELSDQFSETLISASAYSNNAANSEESIVTAPATNNRLSRSTFQLMPPPAAAEQGRPKKSRREKPEEITHEPSPPSAPGSAVRK